MAREMIVRCDGAVTVRVKDCTEEHDDTRTFTIQTNGETWEVDLGGAHAAALLTLAKRGRSVNSRTSDNRSLNRRVRGVPVPE